MIADRVSNLVVPAVFAIVAIVIFFLVHPLQKFVFVSAMIAAFVCYLRTSYREMPEVESVLPVYLIALAVQFLHFTEEYVYGFHQRVTEIMAGTPPFDVDVFVDFNMIAYCIFLLGAVGIYKGMKPAMIVVWFFVFAGALGNAIWHTLLALKVGGYFPGLFTSFAYWIIGPILLRRLWRR